MKQIVCLVPMVILGILAEPMVSPRAQVRSPLSPMLPPRTQTPAPMTPVNSGPNPEAHPALPADRPPVQTDRPKLTADRPPVQTVRSNAHSLFREMAVRRAVAFPGLKRNPASRQTTEAIRETGAFLTIEGF